MEEAIEWLGVRGDELQMLCRLPSMPMPSMFRALFISVKEFFLDEPSTHVRSFYFHLVDKLPATNRTVLGEGRRM